MAESQSKTDLQACLLRLARDEVGLRLLSMLSVAQCADLAQASFNSDYLNCGTITRRALSRIGRFDDCSLETRALRHITHIVQAFQRFCQWRTNGICQVQNWTIVGTKYVEETRGKGTIVISPMVLHVSDTVPLVQRLFGGRDLIFYGEDIHDAEMFASVDDLTFLSSKNARFIDIVRRLKQGAVFCTYPDFVYPGHRKTNLPFLGGRRDFSTGFIRLCMLSDIFLLPVEIKVDTSELLVEEALELELPKGADVETELYSGSVVSALLESQIRRNPETWLLLGSLAAEANVSF